MRIRPCLSLLALLFANGLPCHSEPILDAAAKVAIAEATKAIGVAPNADNYAERARLYSVHKMFSEAVEDDDQVVRLDPNNPQAHWFRGYDLMHMKKYNEAIPDYNITLSLAKRGTEAYAQALRGRAECCYELGRLTNAITDLTELRDMGDVVAAKDLLKVQAELKKGAFAPK